MEFLLKIKAHQLSSWLTDQLIRMCFTSIPIRDSIGYDCRKKYMHSYFPIYFILVGESLNGK